VPREMTKILPVQGDTTLAKHAVAPNADQKSAMAIRDLGPYSARNTSKGALVFEAGQIFGALAGGRTVIETRDDVLAGRLLSQRSRNTRKSIWTRLHYRYLTHRTDWIITAFVEALDVGVQSRRFLTLLYLHYALRDRLTHDFVTEVLWHKGYHSRPRVSRNDVLDLLDRKAENHPEIRRWSETSRVKLAGSVLTALRDFGVLEGIQKKFLVRPTLPILTAKHLLRILIAEGNRGREVLENPTWRLFMLTEQEVAKTLAELAQESDVHFEKVGTTVVLQTPIEWENCQ